MKKKIIIILLLILVLLVFFFLYKKGKNDNQDSNITLTQNLDINLLKLVNKKEEDNFLISPYSIKMALSLLKEGASGNTLNEINKILSNGPSKINNQYIKVANALFVKENLKQYIEKSYITNLQTKYNSELLVDKFTTPDIINNWVNKNTDGMIEKILDKMDNDFVLGLANALAIDVKWQNEFECISTKEEEFTMLNNKTKKAQMMHNSYSDKDYKYINSPNAKGIILPYSKDSNLEFIGLLPNDNLNSYIANYLEEDLTNLPKLQKSASSDTVINLSIPRFTFSYSLDNFKDILTELGIKDVFNKQSADLSKIISKENLNKMNKQNIYVDEAIHKTYINFNETGTKAAATTYFGIKADGLLMGDNSIDITFNKPFIAIIREKVTNEILFQGVVNNPNTWNGNTCTKY